MKSLYCTTLPPRLKVTKYERLEPRYNSNWIGVGPSLALRMLPHALELSNAIPHVITKMGEEGCLYVGRSEQVPVVKYFEPKHILPQDVTSVTGAGDR